MERYDPQTGGWTPLASMSTARFSPGAGVIGSKLYVVGGFNSDSAGNTQILNSLEIYDPQTDSWKGGNSGQNPASCRIRGSGN
jgi:N-acetylneuraminic acid mutarotase